MQSSLTQQNIQKGVQQPVQQTCQPCQVHSCQSPTQTQSGQNQNIQVPNYSGVNIQIFNPSVNTPGANPPTYNVNAPNYGTNSGCYPPNYYINDMGKSKEATAKENITNTNNTTTNTTENTNKKTEKRKIVQLTDEYIRNLENYLNSQDKEVRLMGAKEVVARLTEDDSRKDDLALNALINKMLQDPSTPVRILALSALDSRVVTGDDFTVAVLKQMQNSQSGYGQDAMQATNILLKMSGKTIEKEFEVKNDTKKTKTETK